MEQYNNVIRDILKYIEDNLDKKLTLNIIASNFNISTFHLHRVFSYKRGITLLRYIRYRKLKK